MYLRAVDFHGVSFTKVGLVCSVIFLQLRCNYFQLNETCGFNPTKTAEKICFKVLVCKWCDNIFSMSYINQFSVGMFCT